MSCFGLFGDGDQHLSDTNPLQLPISNLTPASKTQTHICSVCKSSSAKYCCPSCRTRTCSLTCCRKHKDSDMCSGKRTIPYRKISEFTDKDLVDDYFTLEEVNDGIARAKRARFSICKTQSVRQRDLPSWMLKVKHEARLRGTRIISSPSGSSRAMANKTNFHYDSKQIFWTVEWVFANEKGLEFKITDQPVCEKEYMDDLLSRKLRADELDKRLQPYAASAPQLVVLLRHNASGRFHAVDMNVSLGKALLGKSVVDYPTFVVTHFANRKKFNECEDGELLAESPLNNQVSKKKSDESNSSSSSSSESETSDDEDDPPEEIPSRIPASQCNKDDRAEPATKPVVQEEKEDGECSDSDDDQIPIVKSSKYLW